MSMKGPVKIFLVNQKYVRYWGITSKLKSRSFCSACLSTYHLPTLYTNLSHNLIKDKLVDLKGFEKKSEGKVSVILHVMIVVLSSPLMQSKIIIYVLSESV